MITRLRFDIDTDTNPQGDTGHLQGEIVQAAWSPTTGDTGGDLQLALIPRTGDTGDGFVFYNRTDCLGSNFNFVPRQPSHDTQGAVDQTDTGTFASPQPIFGAGDRLRIKTIPGGAALSGRLYVWVRD